MKKIMKKCKKNYKRFDSINVIPFIDIMLVLLVMVLTTATFIRQGIINVDLPTTKGATKKQNNKKEITIYINAKGDIFLDKNRVSIDELHKKLMLVKKDQDIVLRSDKESKFQSFVTVMNILKQLNLEQLYIVTKE